MYFSFFPTMCGQEYYSSPHSAGKNYIPARTVHGLPTCNAREGIQSQWSCIKIEFVMYYGRLDTIKISLQIPFVMI